MAIRKPGPYAPLSAHYADDEAIMAAGEHAELLYVRMLAYAARTPLTEGWISEVVVLTRLGFRETVREEERELALSTRIERLLDVGLIVRYDTGFQIVSWLRWNRSCEEMGREQSRDRTRKARDLDLSGNAAGIGAPHEDGNSGGNPAALPAVKSLANQNTNQITARRSAVLDKDPDFMAFWDAYPRRTDKGHAKKAWIAMLKKDVDIGVVITAVKSYAVTCQGTDPKFIPHPATWLNGERWTDEQVKPPYDPDAWMQR